MHQLFAEEHRLDLERFERSRQLAEMPADVGELPATPEPRAAGTIDGATVPSIPEQCQTVVDATQRGADGEEGESVSADSTRPIQTERIRGRAPLPRQSGASVTHGSSSALEGDSSSAPDGSAVLSAPGDCERPASASSAPPTQVLSVFRRRRVRRNREVLIVAGAVVLAAGLVFATWFSTRAADQDARGGIVVITDPPNAEVMLDGVRVGVTPYSASVPVGRRRLAIRKPGYTAEARDVVIGPHGVAEVNVSLRDGHRPVE
jgi:hypothetical protein